jgi:hypothetical protein
MPSQEQEFMEDNLSYDRSWEPTMAFLVVSAGGGQHTRPGDNEVSFRHLPVPTS